MTPEPKLSAAQLPPNAPRPQTPELSLAELTRRYARYSRSAGGLSSMLGGTLCIGVFVLGLLLTLTPTSRLLLASAPVVWLLCKEFLARFYYQRQGRVEQRMSTSEWRWHIGFTAIVALISLDILIPALLHADVASLAPGQWGYLGVVALLPLVVWRWLWSGSDFIVGVCLFSQSAVFLRGDHYPLNWLGAYLIGAGLLGLIMGYAEHIDFKRVHSALFGQRK